MTTTAQDKPPILATRLRRFRVVVILGSLSALAPLSIDAYLPGLPQVTRDLGTTTSAAQLSLTAFVVGMSFGQLVVGPASDALGRRRPLVAGTAAFTLASLVCVFAPGIATLDAVRVLEGFAGGAGVVVARAVVRDLFAGPAAARFFASLMLVNGLAPVLAPVLGAQLLRVTSWRGVFVGLSAIGLALLLGVLLGLPETLPAERRGRGGLPTTLRTFWRLLHDRALVGYSLAAALAFAAMFAYISGSPFVLQDIYGLSPQAFSGVFAVNSVGIVICAQLGGRLAHRVGSGRLLAIGVGGSVTGGVVLLVSVLAGAGLPGVLPGLFLVASSVGTIFPNAMALALNQHAGDAGAASALMGVLQFLIGGIAAPLVGVAGQDTAIPLGVVIATCSVLAVLSWLALVRPGHSGPA
ncbi:MAG: multidrug effflux MFS transporter [Acidothermales bacterium]|nr:multidrug effflux MFS transporter [Acidothermales bacterium]